MMNGRIGGLGDVLYVLLGVLNLLVALMITVGGMFSSVVFGYGMGLLVDLPIALGLAGIFEYRRQFSLLMAFGCLVIISYIAVATYFSIKSGYPMLRFRKAWAALCAVEIALSLWRFRQLRQTKEAVPWPQ